MGDVTAASGSGGRESLADAYAAALQDYVSGQGEAALTRAYELGRKAASQGIGVLDLAMLHHEALQRLPGESLGARPAIALAGEFLAESLSPFEMTLRAYQANARLLGLSETLARQNAEIDLAREQLRTILDATSAVIYLKDAEGRYLFVNREFQAVFGRSGGDIIGRTDAEALPAQVAAILRAHDEEILAAATPRELEETIPESDGDHTFISLKFPLLDAAGRPHAVCCVATDITGRKRADDALRRAKDALEAANRDLESFSYSVAHDLRAPLRSIDGFSQIVLEDHADKIGADGRKYLQRVRDLAQHMAELIDDLLSLARVSRSELRHGRVDLSSLARRIAGRLRAAEPERQVELAIADDVVVRGDPGLLGIVLDNLLGNAWKFTRKRAEARIELGQLRDDGRTVIYVRDNGAGFNMEHADKLFGVFQRMHTTREFEGTGIGLATVQRIVARHGGRVWAQSAVDQGTTLYFTLDEDGEQP